MKIRPIYNATLVQLNARPAAKRDVSLASMKKYFLIVIVLSEERPKNSLINVQLAREV